MKDSNRRKFWVLYVILKKTTLAEPTQASKRMDAVVQELVTRKRKRQMYNNNNARSPQTKVATIYVLQRQVKIKKAPTTISPALFRSNRQAASLTSPSEIAGRGRHKPTSAQSTANQCSRETGCRNQ